MWKTTGPTVEIGAPSARKLGCGYGGGASSSFWAQPSDNKVAPSTAQRIRDTTVAANTWYRVRQPCIVDGSMVAVSLDQVLRNLPDEGEVRLELGLIPFDELLVTLHETRFVGAVEIGEGENVDRLRLREGQIVAARPPAQAHLRLVTELMASRHIMSGEALRELLTAAPNLQADGVLIRAKRLGLVGDDRLEDLRCDVIRARLFEMYDRGPQPVFIQQGASGDFSANKSVNPLPAVAYGIVNRAHPARRRAMLALAAGKRVSLECAYDVRRNRYGLPENMLSAIDHLNSKGVVLGPSRCLPGIDAFQTAGILLLFQRVGLLRMSEPTHAPMFAPIGLEMLSEGSDVL